MADPPLNPAKLGDLAFAHTTISAVWPPMGVALASVLLGGYALPAEDLAPLLGLAPSGAARREAGAEQLPSLVGGIG